VKKNRQTAPGLRKTKAVNRKCPDESTLLFRVMAPKERAVAARIMASSQPWLTLGRKETAARELLGNLNREVYVAEMDGQMAGFIVLCMTGAFVGYLQTICVAREFRNRGIGTALIHFAEKRIFRESPNVFLLVSSFNKGAQRLYARLGYKRIGELRDYVIAGYSEILMRKSIGMIDGFRAQKRRRRVTGRPLG
jgi:[ribosomal protein S18]-alanine N-acetyltransferase